MADFGPQMYKACTTENWVVTTPQTSPCEQKGPSGEKPNGPFCSIYFKFVLSIIAVISTFMNLLYVVLVSCCFNWSFT